MGPARSERIRYRPRLVWDGGRTPVTRPAFRGGEVTGPQTGRVKHPGHVVREKCFLWNDGLPLPETECGGLAVCSRIRSAAAAPSPVMGNMPPNDGMPGGPIPPASFRDTERNEKASSERPARTRVVGVEESVRLYRSQSEKPAAPPPPLAPPPRTCLPWAARDTGSAGTHCPPVAAARYCARVALPPRLLRACEGCNVRLVCDEEGGGGGRVDEFVVQCQAVIFLGPPGSQQSPHAQPPPHNPSNPMMGPHGQPFMSPRYPGGPRPSLRMPNQPPVGVPGSQPLLPNSLDPTRPQGHPNMGGPMRMNPPRGMGGMGPQNYGGMRPPPNSLGGPGMPGMNMGPGGRGPWPNPNANSIAYSSSSPGNYVGPPGGGGPPGTPIMPSPGDSTNSSENIYTMMNPIGPGGNRPNFPMGPGPDGPMGGMGAMEPHHMNGSLGSGDMDGLPKNSPNNMAGMNNPPGTPRDDGEMAGNFLNPFQNESYSPNMTMSPPGMPLERGTHGKAAAHPRVCKVGGNRKQSQSHRKSLLTESPCLPGFLTGPGQ
ncbi:hypothetical protein COCON_G00059490 [Conger conger]|uniref:Single stranded DNA binding protein 4 n=1 Tax=Conger conger TaxID=82655 RepID=A0A9Q1I3F9_CONCO|nr:hypothetical protein COCON_G00059490 [Conger conger]